MNAFFQGFLAAVSAAAIVDLASAVVAIVAPVAPRNVLRLIDVMVGSRRE